MKVTTDATATVMEKVYEFIKSLFGFNALVNKTENVKDFHSNVKEDIAETAAAVTANTLELIKGKYSEEEVAIISSHLDIGIDNINFIELGKDLNRDPKLVKAKAKKLLV